MGKDHETAHAAFEDFYRATAAEVAAFVARRVHWDSVADTVADIYGVLWRRWDDVPSAPEDRYWLFGVARRICWRRAERDQIDLRRHVHEGAAGEFSGGPDSTDGVSIGESLRAAMDQLPAEDRELLILACVEERSRSEIAGIMDIEVGTLNVRIFRARARFRKLLEEQTAGDPEFAVGSVTQ